MKQSHNLIMRGCSGALGKELVFRQRAGKTVVCLPPAPRKDNPTASQKKVRTRFREASRYAKTALADPPKKAAYAIRAKTGQTANNVAVADYLHAPIITSADAINYSGAPGDIISIHATDDFEVQSVHIAILDENGNVREQGLASAIDEGKDTWTYIFTHTHTGQVKARIQARDLPGNVTTMELAL